MILAVDTETTGSDFFHGCRPFLFTACNGEEVFWEWGEVDPFTRNVTWEPDAIQRIQSLLDRATQIIFFNAQFDIRALQSIGIDISALWAKSEDANIAAHAIHSAHISEDGAKTGKKKYVGRTLGLKPLCMEYFGWDDEDEKELDRAVQAKRKEVERLGYAIARAGHPHFPAARKNTKWYKLDMWLCPEECLRYALLDAERTFIVWAAFVEALWDDGLMSGYRLRRDLLPICYNITSEGIYVDEDGLRGYIKRIDKKMDIICQYLRRRMGINYKIDLNKPNIKNQLVHKTLGVPVIYKTDTGAPSLNKEALEGYAKKYRSKELRAYMKWKKWETKKRYAESYLNHAYEERIHGSIKITGTVGTRQSAIDPNTQNIDPILEEYIGPPPGHIWLCADYKNIEMVIWARNANSKKLLSLFDQGILVHDYVMGMLYPLEAKRYIQNKEDKVLKTIYKKCKAGNFSIAYGGTENKADRTYGYPGSYRKVISEFDGVEEYIKKQIREVYDNVDKEMVPAIYTAHGYRLDVPLSEPFVACNRRIQGDAGIIMTKAMVAVSKEPRYRSKDCQMVMQVHDSAKIQIPFHDTIRTTIYSLVDAMENCAYDRFGRCPMDYEIKYNKADYHRKIRIKC